MTCVQWSPQDAGCTMDILDKCLRITLAVPFPRPLEACGECIGTCTVHSVYVKCIV